MELNNTTVLVTGANRGIGAQIVAHLLERGVAKVYATSRSVDGIVDSDERVVRLPLDVTDQSSVDAVARTADDVDVLINNAGISSYNDLVFGDEAKARREVETNFWGPIRMTRAFAPILAARGGGAMATVLSALSLASFRGATAYAASKAAAWSFTEGARLELADQRTQVTAAFLAATDTDMMAGVDVPKNTASDVARAILDAVERGDDEVYIDEPTRAVKAALAGSVRGRYADQLPPR